MTDERTSSIDEMAADLAASPDFKVLRRARIKATINTTLEPTRSGIVVDATTTGRDAALHEVICLTALPFTFTVSGLVISSGFAFQRVREPSGPLSPDVASRTGLSKDLLAGHSIDADELDQEIGDASLVVAFDAAQVRPFLELLCDRFAKVAWGCASTQVPWREEGFRPGRLEDLLLQHDLFLVNDSALDRCDAVLRLLAQPMPASGVPALAPLLARVRQPSFRIWAIGARSMTRGLLSSHGYVWNSGTDGRARAWFKDVAPDCLDGEHEFLTSFWFDGSIDPKVETLDALNRFSVRV